MNDTWRIYFWVMVAILTIYTPMLIVITDAARIDAVPMIFSYVIDVVSMFALYGYYKKRKLAVRGFWIFVFLILTTGTGLKHYYYWHNFKVIFEEGPAIAVLMSVLFIFTTVPLAMGVYLYAFKSNALWAERV